MAAPILPQHDPDPAQREALRISSCEDHVHDATLLPPFVVPRSLPAAERGPAAGLGERLAAALGLPANFAAVKLATLIDRFDELQDHEDIFKLLDRPAIVDHWRSDAMFAEQRLAGVECRLLRAVPRLPADLRLPAADFAAITGMSLDHAAAEGRLHIVDHALLDGIEVGETDGHPKFLYAPISLYCWLDDPGTQDMLRDTPRRGRLAPVAIQLDQRPRPDNLYTPRDGPEWLLARTAVQAADDTLNVLGHRLPRIHLALASVALTTARQLAEVHPLAALLRPHLRGVMARSDAVCRDELAPDGPLTRLFACTRAGALELAARSHRAWDFGAWSLPRDLAARGVDDPETLPHYPFRDDGLLIWRAIHEFVARYMDCFYTSDADLHADPELRAWLSELADPTRGNLPGLPAWPLTRAALTELTTHIIFNSGPYHSASNDRQAAYATYAPNLPMALYSPLPPRGSLGDPAAAERALMAMLPPQSQVLAQLALVRSWQLHPSDPLGHYGDADPLLTDSEHIQELVTAFQDQLSSAEGEILRRNQSRRYPYLGLLPSRTANSAGA